MRCCSRGKTGLLSRMKKQHLPVKKPFFPWTRPISPLASAVPVRVRFSTGGFNQLLEGNQSWQLRKKRRRRPRRRRRRPRRLRRRRLRPRRPSRRRRSGEEGRGEEGRSGEEGNCEEGRSREEGGCEEGPGEEAHPERRVHEAADAQTRPWPPWSAHARCPAPRSSASCGPTSRRTSCRTRPTSAWSTPTTS